MKIENQREKINNALNNNINTMIEEKVIGVLSTVNNVIVTIE